MSKRNNVFRSGEPFIWFSGVTLGLVLILLLGLLGLVVSNGLGFFWPKAVVAAQLKDGSTVLGEIVDAETAHLSGAEIKRLKFRRGNRDIYGDDFVWVDEDKITSLTTPADATVIERREWGNFYGFIEDPNEDREELRARLTQSETLLGQIERLEKKDIGALSAEQEEARLAIKGLALEGITSGPKVEALNNSMLALQLEFKDIEDKIAALRSQQTSLLKLKTTDGHELSLPLAQIINFYRPNELSLLEKIEFSLSHAWRFISEDPRESNTEGGVFPAIFGTVMMVFIMSIIVTPLGVLAAIYLRDYAKQGPLVSLVRIAVNNLAGVPSIVFGVFGVGFFVYFLGGNIDRLFYPEALPTPTYGTGGVLWASLTLALLTLPTVIVATEEGLAAIPKNLREASYALGATKFETTVRVVLPALLPAILTGMILAVSRAAGEVAPLMITGVVKLAPSLPLDGTAPFFHLNRKFMHLGFHIYDVGFQSPNVDAARPMVFTTTLLLLLIVVLLNISAVTIRARLKKRYTLTGV